MAARKADTKPLSRFKALLALTDIELGQELRNLLERESRYSLSYLASVLPFDRYFLQRLPALSKHYFKLAIDDPALALYGFAHILALEGQFDRAGAAFRAYLTKGIAFNRDLTRAEKQRLALILRNSKRSATKFENIERWFKAGCRIRLSEKGWPITNRDLAKKIARAICGNENTIRLEIPSLGLDAGTWREIARAKNPVKGGDAKKTNRNPLSTKSIARRH